MLHLAAGVLDLQSRLHQEHCQPGDNGTLVPCDVEKCCIDQGLSHSRIPSSTERERPPGDSTVQPRDSSVEVKLPESSTDGLAELNFSGKVNFCHKMDLSNLTSVAPSGDLPEDKENKFLRPVSPESQMSDLQKSFSSATSSSNGSPTEVKTEPLFLESAGLQPPSPTSHLGSVMTDSGIFVQDNTESDSADSTELDHNFESKSSLSNNLRQNPSFITSRDNNNQKAIQPCLDNSEGSDLSWYNPVGDDFYISSAFAGNERIMEFEPGKQSFNQQIPANLQNTRIETLTLEPHTEPGIKLVSKQESYLEKTPSYDPQDSDAYKPCLAMRIYKDSGGNGQSGSSLQNAQQNAKYEIEDIIEVPGFSGSTFCSESESPTTDGEGHGNFYMQVMPPLAQMGLPSRSVMMMDYNFEMQDASWGMCTEEPYFDLLTGERILSTIYEFEVSSEEDTESSRMMAFCQGDDNEDPSRRLSTITMNEDILSGEAFVDFDMASFDSEAISETGEKNSTYKGTSANSEIITNNSRVKSLSDTDASANIIDFESVQIDSNTNVHSDNGGISDNSSDFMADKFLKCSVTCGPFDFVSCSDVDGSREISSKPPDNDGAVDTETFDSGVSLERSDTDTGISTPGFAEPITNESLLHGDGSYKANSFAKNEKDLIDSSDADPDMFTPFPIDDVDFHVSSSNTIFGQDILFVNNEDQSNRVECVQQELITDNQRKPLTEMNVHLKEMSENRCTKQATEVHEEKTLESIIENTRLENTATMEDILKYEHKNEAVEDKVKLGEQSENTQQGKTAVTVIVTEASIEEDSTTEEILDASEPATRDQSHLSVTFDRPYEENEPKDKSKIECDNLLSSASMSVCGSEKGVQVVEHNVMDNLAKDVTSLEHIQEPAVVCDIKTEPEDIRTSGNAVYDVTTDVENLEMILKDVTEEKDEAIASIECIQEHNETADSIHPWSGKAENICANIAGMENLPKPTSTKIVDLLTETTVFDDTDLLVTPGSITADTEPKYSKESETLSNVITSEKNKDPMVLENVPERDAETLETFLGSAGVDSTAEAVIGNVQDPIRLERKGECKAAENTEFQKVVDNVKGPITIEDSKDNIAQESVSFVFATEETLEGNVEADYHNHSSVDSSPLLAASKEAEEVSVPEKTDEPSLVNIQESTPVESMQVHTVLETYQEFVSAISAQENATLETIRELEGVENVKELTETEISKMKLIGNHLENGLLVEDKTPTSATENIPCDNTERSLLTACNETSTEYEPHEKHTSNDADNRVDALSECFHSIGSGSPTPPPKPKRLYLRRISSETKASNGTSSTPQSPHVPHASFSDVIATSPMRPTRRKQKLNSPSFVKESEGSIVTPRENVVISTENENLPTNENVAKAGNSGSSSKRGGSLGQHQGEQVGTEPGPRDTGRASALLNTNTVEKDILESGDAPVPSELKQEGSSEAQISTSQNAKGVTNARLSPFTKKTLDNETANQLPDIASLQQSFLRFKHDWQMGSLAVSGENLFYIDEDAKTASDSTSNSSFHSADAFISEAVERSADNDIISRLKDTNQGERRPRPPTRKKKHQSSSRERQAQSDKTTQDSNPEEPKNLFSSPPPVPKRSYRRSQSLPRPRKHPRSKSPPVLAQANKRTVARAASTATCRSRGASHGLKFSVPEISSVVNYDPLISAHSDRASVQLLEDHGDPKDEEPTFNRSESNTPRVRKRHHTVSGAFMHECKSKDDSFIKRRGSLREKCMTLPRNLVKKVSGLADKSENTVKCLPKLFNKKSKNYDLPYTPTIRSRTRDFDTYCRYDFNSDVQSPSNGSSFYSTMEYSESEREPLSPSRRAEIESDSKEDKSDDVIVGIPEVPRRRHKKVVTPSLGGGGEGATSGVENERGLEVETDGDSRVEKGGGCHTDDRNEGNKNFQNESNCSNGSVFVNERPSDVRETGQDDEKNTYLDEEDCLDRNSQHSKDKEVLTDRDNLLTDGEENKYERTLESGEKIPPGQTQSSNIMQENDYNASPCSSQHILASVESLTEPAATPDEDEEDLCFVSNRGSSATFVQAEASPAGDILDDSGIGIQQENLLDTSNFIRKEKASENCPTESLPLDKGASASLSTSRRLPRSPSENPVRVSLQTWAERQGVEDLTLPSQNLRFRHPFSDSNISTENTPSPDPPVEAEKEEQQREETLQEKSQQKREEERIQKDRCIEVYPETVRQRQRNMMASPHKVDIKNWNSAGGGNNNNEIQTSPSKVKKFLPSVKALRNQFETGKNNNNRAETNGNSNNCNNNSNLSLSRKSSSSSSSLASSTLEKTSSTNSLSSTCGSMENLLSPSSEHDLHIDPDEPVEPIYKQFKKMDEELREMMSKPPSTTGWNPRPLLKRLYYIPEAPKMQSQGTTYVNIEGYLEKLPSGRKKATFWNAWKRRYFVAKDGVLYYYQSTQADKPSMKMTLMGGKVECMEPNMVGVDDGSRDPKAGAMIGIDDGKGHYVVVRCSSRQEAERWKRALETHTVEDFASQYVQPWPVPTNPALLRDTLVIDLGSSSVRAGVLASQATLPQVFLPSVAATDRETRRQIWGFEALAPDVRASSSISFPVRPSHKISKYSVDLSAVSSLLQKSFADLRVDPKNYHVQLSVPRVLNTNTQTELLRLLFDKYGVKSVNLTHQSILALYAYNATSGIIVDIGERMDIVPVIDGYIVDGGVSRVPYGGYRILDHLRQFLYMRNISLINEVDSYIIRHVLENICYCAHHYNTEKARCTNNPDNFEKGVSLAEYFQTKDCPFDTISLDFGRFQATEGLFNPDAWGLDHPGLHKLVHKAIMECSMDIRKEMSRSIFLAGGVTQLPGLVERLTTEIDNLTPPAIRPKVHASPYRYHAAYLGACVLAESPAFVQSRISREDWNKHGNAALRKWSL